MSKLRFYLALYAAKFAGWAIRLLGRSGSHNPGAIAMKICPNFMDLAPRPALVVCVTGTNGKTSVSNMLANALRRTGRTVANNKEGSNIVPGCVTNLVNSLDLRGRVRVDACVYETDERASRLILPHLKPDYMIVTNLSRDTLKRNAHTDYIFSVIDTYCPSTVKLVLNADCTCSSQLKPGNDRVYFGVGPQPGDHTAPYNLIADNILCPLCGTRMEYEYLRYNHIGKAQCPSCGHASPEAAFLATHIDRDKGRLTISVRGQEHTYRLVSGMMHYVYNQTAILALLDWIGTSQEMIQSIFQDMNVPDSRLSHTQVGSKTLVRILVKGQNSVSVSRNFDSIASSPEQKTLILGMDDLLDRRHSVEYMGWIWDVEYERLVQDNIRQIMLTGPRCYDQMSRLLLAGFPAERIKCVMDEMEAMEQVLVDGVDTVYFAFDSTILELSNRMKARLLARMEEAK